MPQIRKVLGHVKVEVAEKKRKCHRDSKCAGISKGERCLAIYEGVPATRKNYCPEHAKPILAIAGGQLKTLNETLYK